MSALPPPAPVRPVAPVKPAAPVQVAMPPPPELFAPVAFGPPRPTLFERHWPVRNPSAGTEVFIATLAAGLVAAFAIPIDRPGLGWLLAGCAAAAGLLTVALRNANPAPASIGAKIAAIGWGAAVLALLAVGTVRAAGWLFVLCVLTAVMCAALSVAGARTPVGLVLALLAVPAAALRALPWMRRGTTRHLKGGLGAIRLAASVAVGLLLLVVFGALFASADPAFDRIVSSAVPDFDLGTAFRWAFLFTVFASGTLGGAYLLVNPTTLGSVGGRSTPRPLRRLEWALPVGVLVALFGTFVAIQVTVLFGDRDYVLTTVGLTFAEYARRGFWQLLVITLLTLVVMGVAARKAARVSFGDRLVLRVLLGALALGALVVVASALWRMSVYEQEYGFTRLRLFVSAFELWLGVLFVLVLAAGVRLRAGWLPQLALATWVLTLLGLAVLNPDRFIAQQNVTRYEQTGRIDAWYLSTLSPDAAPELNRLSGTLRNCTLTGIAKESRKEPDDWRGFNISRRVSDRIVEDLPLSYEGCIRRY
jgi:hypothetical protein